MLHAPLKEKSLLLIICDCIAQQQLLQAAQILMHPTSIRPLLPTMGVAPSAAAPIPVKKLENLAYSAEALSDVDLFDTYVSMPNWEFEPYVALNTIKAASKYNKKGMVKFPQFLGRISTMYKNRREKLNYEDVQFFEKEKPKPKVKKESKTKEKEVKVKEKKEPKSRAKK